MLSPIADPRPATQPEGETEMKAPFLIGRLLFAGFFINSGISHLQKRKEMAEYARAKGVPAPELAVTLSAVPLIAGGASLLLGVKPKAGAMAILGFLAGVSPVMHDFWRDQDPETRNTNMIMFMKNMALAGAALALLGVEEPWEASLQPGKPSLGDKVRRIGRRIAA
jgi:putative oxidoreductase